MQTKVFSWFREMMDYYEVGSWKKPPGGGKLGKLYMSAVDEKKGKPEFKFWETARAKGKG